MSSVHLLSYQLWKKSVSVFLDSGSEINAVHLVFAKKLGFTIRPTDVGAQKIDGITLETHRMVVAAFLVKDKANRVRFFEETFLVVNISLEVVFGILFFILSGADIDFLGCELRWRTYTIEEALSTTRRVELVGKIRVVTVALDTEHETYIVHVGSVSFNALPSSSPLELDVHPFRRP